MLTLGNEMSAADLKGLGIVQDVLDSESFDEQVIAFARQYERLSSSAVAMTKRLLYDIDSIAFSRSLDVGAEVNAQARMTDDCKKGIARFLEK